MKTHKKLLWLLIVLITFFTLSAKGQHIGVENEMLDIPVVRNSRTTEPVVKDYLTPEYDSSKYVRIAEFQELKQKLNDQKEAYRRELMGLILAKFCTFMSPEKAAIEAVKYSEALLKELEK